MMTKKSGHDDAPLSLRSRAEIMASPAALLMGQAQNEEQAEILRNTDTDFLRQRAFVAKELHGQQVLRRGAEAAAHNYVGFANYAQALRAQVQGTEAQHRIEQFLSRLEEDHANSLLATHYIAERKVQDIVAASVDPPAWREEEFVVDVPNIVQQFFGGQSKITRTRR